VGRLEREKGHEYLLRALADFDPADVWHWELKVVGDGSLRQSLDSLTKQLKIEDRVHFVGSVPPGPAVDRLLSEADLFILPSLIEGTPRALLEAMSQGLPVIASDVGGVTGLLPREQRFAPGNSDSLLTVLRAVLNGNPAALSATGHARAWEVYGPDRMLASLRGFHERLKNA
jgi:glycosyltransferase involved in cell wall biosynthesis